MLNPIQIAQWREAVARDPGLIEFEGHNSEAALVIPCSSRHGEAEPSEVLGNLYSPTRIFGTPHDPSCLNGVGESAIYIPRGTIERLSNARIIGFAAVMSQDN